MKTYPHCIQKLFYKPLVITPQRHAALCRVLESRMAGHQEPDGDENIIIEQQPEPEPDWQTFGPDAVIPVHGVLTCHEDDIPMSACGCGLDTVSAMLDVATADPEIKKIIFDFRTPGGEVTGIPELASKIAAVTSQKTIAFTDSECCSGGIWLASQCQYFYTAPSASVGSIGVWCAYLDISRALANAGENMQAISAGKYKLLGAYWKALSDDERGMVQGDVDKIYRKFKEAVNQRREISDEYMQGQIFDGEEAVEIGLCDGLVNELGDLLSDGGEE